MSGVLRTRITPRLLEGALCALLATTAAHAEESRVRVVDYDRASVLPLTLFVGFHVHVEFAPDEHFVNLGAGDSAVLDVAAEANHLFIKPRQPAGPMNLTILTDRRVYYVDYRALGRAPHADELVYGVVFRYPAPPPPVVVPVVAPVVRPVEHTDYWYAGATDLAPVRAVDDGLQTRLTFSPSTALPALYVIESDGAETLVNTHIENDTVVAHRVARRFLLRRGALSGCLENRDGPAVLTAPSSGTIDPAVRRVVVGEGS
jgi:type IV secretion system protein VirB9